ncbi:hypothetical protein VE01_01490 [Pseudogymnoascus verrucosus]|uniref:Uncharacterized protein n=1 Tax=Pseudogymnoascus verrucosus TaxID=342668 RepID=A0A1B8GXC3_9PEZI|nr:uncharacterized protein VE01_01490 [Pseudogymnoascus verrucosus]OBU00457.1 hypothetical protein VE01_01490 [Pseudogymnoascus verrucosus]
MPPSPSLSGPPQPPPYPLYNTTYTLHRLSPLYSFTLSSLPSHTTALSEILTGSTLRGVRIGLDTTDVSLSRAGALRGVSMRPLRNPDGWAAVHAAAEPDDTGIGGGGEDGEVGEGWGVIIEITYEKANYTALLLRDIHNSPATTTTTTTEREGGFTHLPLLLTRLPPPLRTTLLDFLATRFDTRASPMHLPSDFLQKALGGYIDALVAGGGDVRGGVREVVISLAFPAGGAGDAGEGGGGELKNIDITISRDDIVNFLERGRNTSTTTTTNTPTPPTTTEHHPFWTALHTYTTTHLSLSLTSPSVSVVKIACGAFVIAAEGRVKISAPSARGEREGAEGVVGALIASAARMG